MPLNRRTEKQKQKQIKHSEAAKKRTQSKRELQSTINDEEPAGNGGSVDEAIRNWKKVVDNEMLNLEPGSYEYKDTRKSLFKEFRKVPDVIRHLNIKYPKTKKEFGGVWIKGINNDIGGGLDKLLAILKYLSDNSLDADEARKLLSQHKTEAKWYNSVIFCCEDFEEMSVNLLADGLHIKPEQIHRYLRWLRKNQFIYVIGQTGQRGHNIYSVGYRYAYEDKKEHIEKPGKHLWFQRIHKDKAKKDFEWRKHYSDALRNFKRTFSQTP
jgi:hypothetical protein